jgi:hypothetical protein
MARTTLLPTESSRFLTTNHQVMTGLADPGPDRIGSVRITLVQQFNLQTRA